MQTQSQGIMISTVQSEKINSMGHLFLKVLHGVQNENNNQTNVTKKHHFKLVYFFLRQ
jgi:hypothetical protein